MKALLAAFFMLFGISGRLNRTKYWVGIAITVLLLMPTSVALRDARPPQNPLEVVSLVLGYWAWSAILIKRLHDFNWSGWWWCLIGGFPVFALVRVSQVVLSLELIRVGLIFLAGIIIILIVGAANGTVGPNKYGPDPRGSS